MCSSDLPTDSPQWINFDMENPDFESEPRNLRLGLCTDGMNPYGAFSSLKTTWPVILVLYNLASWLCMKRKYLLMPLVISGPKQPENDIDVYLAPLIEDLITLWDKGIEVFDAYSQERFNLRAMIFCTINDFPAYGNLSGHKVKGNKACPTCGSETCTVRLKNVKRMCTWGIDDFFLPVTSTTEKERFQRTDRRKVCTDTIKRT